jgi:phenylacetic acid degradation operon negative regulatory protein
VEARVSEPGQPSPWIVTLFGLYARPDANWLPISAVVALMADLGVDGATVRSSISRLKRRGVLAGSRRGAAAGYELTGDTLSLLAEGDERIFRHTRAALSDGWVVVTFSVPEAERERRAELRATLTRLGFGTVAAGVWVAPGHLAPTVCAALERRGLSAYADVFAGPHVAFGDLAAKVRRWWNLPELAARYDDFLARWSGLPEATSPLDAFRTYVPMLTQWRRLPYRDPGIPLALLPAGWTGVAAGAQFDRLDRALGPRAATHVRALPGRVTPTSRAAPTS